MKTAPQNKRSTGRYSTGIKKSTKKVAARITYGILLFYYVVSSSHTSWNDKIKIYGALGYILLPYDLIPESIHIAGFTDDFAAVAIGCRTIQMNITPHIVSQVSRQLWKLFKTKIQRKSNPK